MSFNINNRRYTGSKTKIINWINKIIDENCKNCNSFFDVFAGTGVVTNSLLSKFENFYLNDFLYSNEIIYNAFFGMQKFSWEKILKFYETYKNLDIKNIKENYVSQNYGGKFFEYKDALQIGYIREDLEINKDSLNKREFDILLASLIYSFDRSANTVGHYESYFKNNKNLRSTFKFDLINPIINNTIFKKKIKIFREDSNILAPKISADIAYIDPPYSSRQYSRFYHVIENIVKWRKPELFGKALKPKPENMSLYCSSKALETFRSLIDNLKCKYILVSYNNTYNSKSKSSENKMKLEDIKSILLSKGETKEYSIKHQAFNAGKTNLKNHLEILFFTEVKND
ncbi:DNA adenine methylase [Malacoplasma penetrans]|nr:DNA adenine methylase [Malacoplasma penetrans]